jgi:hypothetical protein
MGAGELMEDAYLAKEGIKMVILSTPVRLDRDYFAIKHMLNEAWNSRKYL